MPILQLADSWLQERLIQERVFHRSRMLPPRKNKYTKSIVVYWPIGKRKRDSSVIASFILLFEEDRSRLNLGASAITTSLSPDFDDESEDGRSGRFARLYRRKGNLMGESSQSFSRGSNRLSLNEDTDSPSEDCRHLFLDGGDGGVTTEIFLRRLGVSKVEVLMVEIAEGCFGAIIRESNGLKL